MTDLLLVCLGSTAGLRAAEDELLGSLERAGASVARVTARPPREVRTFVATDLAWARAARRAALEGIARHAPRAVVYSTTTAALLWPRPGAIRFDALAAATRPGRHGLWQRPLEARRLREATVLVPQAAGAFEGVAPPPGVDVVVVPVPVEASGAGGGRRGVAERPAAQGSASGAGGVARGVAAASARGEPSGAGAAAPDVAVLTYGANWHKKGLDRVLAAWALVGAPGPLVVAGVERGLVEAAWRAGGDAGALPASVEVTGPLAPSAYRALLRRTRVFVAAPRREDYGIAQLEALADGCSLVTTAAPGPYAALPLARALAPDLVLPADADAPALAAALRTALARSDPEHAKGAQPTRIAALLEPFTRANADRVVASELLPRLLRG